MDGTVGRALLLHIVDGWGDETGTASALPV